MSRFAAEVSDEHGTTGVVIDVDLTQAQRTALDQLADRIPVELRWLTIALLVRQIADERAYERVCQERGLLL